ncbi:hypothetical protein GQ600_3829 [Phytophthora cactorum]|nr:hypothetical protein GQ600_3829 [Phytophthora cactorum]
MPSVPPMHGLYPIQASCILLAVIPSASVHWPGFKRSLAQGLSSARKRVAASVKTVDRVNVDHHQALIYRAISSAKKMAGLSSARTRGHGFAVSLTAKVVFFVISSVCSIVAVQENWVSVLECDGTHMKNPQYNGVCVLLVGKDGDWTNISIVIAFIHKQMAENVEWYQDGRSCTLYRQRKTTRSFCALHIFFNVCGHFRSVDPNINNVTALVFLLHATTTLVEYESLLDEIRVAFPVSRKVKVNGNMENQTVDQYLRKIHPTSWTKFGNGSQTPEEASAIVSERKAAPAYGVGCPLFAGRTLGKNHALLLAGIRDCQVFGALTLFCNIVVETLADKKTNPSNWVRDKHTVTPRAKAMFDRQVWNAADSSVRKSTGSVFYVDDVEPTIEEGDSRKTYESTPLLTRGGPRDQITFTHRVLAPVAQIGSTFNFHAVISFHQFTVCTGTSYRPQHPGTSHLQPSHSRGQRDVARREKRILSRGEPKQITSSHGGSRKETKAQTDQIKRAAVATSMREFFSSEIRAAEKKKRAKYTCSQCGKAGSHNAVKCPNRKSGNVESDVEPGDYIVGNCPLELLERRISYVAPEVKNPIIIREYSF